MIKVWRVKTYIDVSDQKLPGIMPLIEVTFILERDQTPSDVLIETLAKVLVPEGSALLSEIVLVGNVPDTK